MSCVAVAADGPVSNVTPPSGASVEQKISPPLLMEMGRKKEVGSKRINVLIRTNVNISVAQRKQMEETGLVIDSVIGDIVTAAGTSEAILRAANLDFVISLEAAKRLEQK